jgi:uncharacterized protein (TIGR03382 family)
VHCGQTLELHGGDADWMKMSIPVGQKATFSIDGAAKGNVSMVATKGSSKVLENGTDVVELTGDGGTFDVGVLPDSAGAGDYTMTVTCKAVATQVVAAKPGAVKGCASAGTPAPIVAALAGLALLRRKRR